MVGHHAAGHGIQPGKGPITRWDLLDAPPRHEKGLGGAVAGVSGSESTPPTVGKDMPVVSGIHLAPRKRCSSVIIGAAVLFGGSMQSVSPSFEPSPG